MANVSTLLAGIVLLGAFSCCCGDLFQQTEKTALAPGADPMVPPPGRVHYVVSASSLKLRAGPSADAAVLADLPRGVPVVVTGSPAGHATVDGITGGWSPVWYSGISGYSFDGFLLPFPAPPKGCTGLDQWATALGHAGPATVIEKSSCASLSIMEDGDCETRKRTPLTGGGWTEALEGYEWGETVLYLPGVSRDPFWAAARSCVSQLDLARRGLPDSAGPVAGPSPGEVMDFATMVEANRWGWNWIDGCSGYVVVEDVGAGMKVSSGGGC